jgi:hypothetical protein
MAILSRGLIRIRRPEDRVSPNIGRSIGIVMLIGSSIRPTWRARGVLEIRH